jgi:four helix bundle protein
VGKRPVGEAASWRSGQLRSGQLEKRPAAHFCNLAGIFAVRSTRHMKTRQYRDLLVWQKSMRLVEAVYTATRALPKEELFGLSSQMRRAAISVPSNIAEGQGRESTRSFAQFLLQAQGSLYELETQIELARNLGLMSPETMTTLGRETPAIGMMLHGLRSALRRKMNTAR